LDHQALDELASFKSGDQSFELRGKVTGVRRGKDFVESVYKDTHSSILEPDKQIEESNNATRESSPHGYIDAGTNPADDKPRTWAQY
jgi:hypothetical protein